ncbi:MAG: DegV family protein [Ruminococcaceae bacterium]|nr:DegV family protein [Oscillospiraceae bacterium]
MSKKVLIASDSTTDLSAELIEKYQIKILPLGVNLGGKSYIDGVDIDPDFIYKYYEEKGELPKTSAANVADFTEFFKKYTDEGYAIVMFTISQTMSSTYNNGRIAAEEFEDVYVVDTKNLSTGGGLLLLAAADMAAQGDSAEVIAQKCTELADRVDASFVLDNLEFLYKGGRCSALAAFGANLLQLKPCIMVRGGSMGVGKKYRGKFAATLEKYIADQIGDASDIELDRIFVTHAGCDKEIYEACVKQVKALAPFKEVLLTRAGCTVSSHCGRNTLGVLFIRKNKLV